MAQENENLNSSNENNDELDLELEDTEDINAIKEQYQKLSETNKRLFARAKKAEGFELVDGKWTKPKTPAKESKSEVEPQTPKESSKPSELDYGQKAFLKTYGIQGPDELALVKSFATRTGDDLDTIVSDEIFLGKLKALRDARESQEAIPKGKGRSAQSSVTNVDIAYANYLEKGEWPSDFETAKALKNKIVEQEKGSASIYTKK